MTKLEDPSEFLTGEFAEKNNVSEIIPLDEGAYGDKTFMDKKTGKEETKRLFEWKIQCNNTEKSIKTHTPNATSIKKLMEISNDDTKNLVGKRIPIIRSYSAGNWIVYVLPTLTKERLVELNAVPTTETSVVPTTTS